MSHEIGTIIELEGAEAVTLETHQDDICSMQQELGTLREEYIEKDALLCKALKDKRAAYHKSMIEVASTHGIDFSSPDVCWKWHPDRLAFERVK